MKVLLVVYDNQSYMGRIPLGLAYIGASLLKNGYEVEVYDQQVHHYPDEHLTKYLDDNKFDAIGVSVIGGYYQYNKLISLSKAINASKNRPFYIIGGHGPSPEPKYFLKKTGADVAVIGEGEETIIELLKAYENLEPFDNILGIAFREGDTVTVNPRRPLIKDIDSIPFPAYELFDMNYYRLGRNPNDTATDFRMTMLSGRGCKFKCNFCYRLDKGLRIRSNKSVIEEIKMLQEKYGITYFMFYDELLMVSADRAISLSQAIMDAGLNIKWYCNGRLNYVTEEAIKIMKEAGCVYINYGIECFDNRILKNMNKQLTTNQITKGIEITLSGGISPGLNIIFGNIGENKETLEKSRDFILKYNDGVELRTIRPVTPYPGSPLYYYAIENGLLGGVEDFYENKHINSDLLAVNFTELTDEEFYEALTEANLMIVEQYYDEMKKKRLEEVKDLYQNKNVKFRGFRSC